ncbi:cobaltochelatase subunit CobN [Methanobrevibacter sp. 87.7]|uniref:cobaltochelatase subunit CobN n=1 Tax=Methanobrevibacter sp. 87.7 TaxID=387957 RepID=UPI0013039C44|nr:cobaltochelatase subunit CobN [Methanobrevibacter sp. 87.7]
MLVFVSSISASELSTNVSTNNSISHTNSVSESNLELVSVNDKNISSNVNNKTSNNALKQSNTKTNIVQDVKNPVLNISTSEAYNKSSKNYTMDGVPVSGATIKIFDPSNTLIYSGVSNNGYALVNSLPSGYGSYKIVCSYSTYVDQTIVFNYDRGHLLNNKVKCLFKPDLCFITYYQGNKNKMDYLLSLSKRVFYIDSVNFNHDPNLWLIGEANYIQMDMFTSSFYTDEVKNFIKDSPANKNHMISYIFGQSDSSGLGFNYVGTKNGNNTINTIENTYIGSYYQPNDYKNSKVISINMENLYAYILYLLGENSVNPVLDPTRTPVMDSTWGIYHPAYGCFELRPNQTQINDWILKDPGFNKDGLGSLNWMIIEYVEWQGSKSMSSIFKDFEDWYNAYQINSTDIYGGDELTDKDSYLSRVNTSSPFVAIVSYYPGGDLMDRLIKEYESQGRAAFNLYQITTTPAMSSLLLLFQNNSKRHISAVNSLYSWSLNYNNSTKAIEELKELNVEVIKVLDKVSEVGYTSDQGPQSEWTYSVTIPSFEGVFGTVLVSYINATTGKECIIDSGVKKLVNLTIGWAKLKEMNNSDKKISIILYNYPPGKSDIGASYLDIFNSTYVMLHLLAQAGYDIGMDEKDIPNLTALTDMLLEACNKGSWAQGYLNSYVDKYWDTLMANHQLINETEFREYLDSLNPKLRKQLIDRWNDTIGNIMVYNGTKHKGKYIVILGIMFGNVFITFQASRGWEVSKIEDYHSSVLPPHQQYISFYKWLSQTYHANALVYMGTHGTMEYLPGKSIGLTEDDWSFELTDTPSIYPYIVSDPGEGIVAVDRMNALVITHMTPASVMSDLYGNLSKINDLIRNYNKAINVGDTVSAEEYKKSILILANSDSLKLPLPSANQTFDDWLEKLDSKLDDLQSDTITYGVHSLGKVLTGYELIQELMTITSSQTDIYTEILHKLYPELNKLDFYKDVYKNKEYKVQINETKTWLNDFLAYLVDGVEFDKVITLFNVTNGSNLYNDLVYANITMNNIRNNMEWDAILTALSGGYVYPGLSGDPAYYEVLPTGRSMYTGDTTKMPTQQSFEAAKNLVNKMIVKYYESHNNTFPKLTGIVMWGTELLRTDALAIAEFLWFLGVKPVWARSGTVTGVELVDLNDLTITLSNGTVINRPRIDVFTSMVTSNVHWISLLINALNLVNNTNESFSQNYIKAHYNETGSLDRLFGLRGDVLEGTGMSDYLPSTDRWYDKDVDLASQMSDIYLDRVSHSWTLDENGNIVVTKKRSNYEYLLKNVDLITQNVDSTWRLLDSDDYFDWLGGLVGASKRLGGNAETYVPDTRNKNDMVVRTLSEQLDLELRTTIANPKYTNALIGSTSGWLQMAAKVQDLYMFSVVTSESIGTGQSKNGGTGSFSSGSVVDSNSFTVAANAINSLYSSVNSASQSYGWQAMAAWMIYASQTGIWNPSSASEKNLLQKLVNNYVDSVVQYQNFACCHHTDPWSFNKDVTQMYTGSSATLAKFNALFKAMSDSQSDIYSEQTAQDIANAASSQVYNGSSTSSSASSVNSGSSSGSSSGSGSGAGSVGDSGASSSNAGGSQSSSNNGKQCSNSEDSQSDSGAGSSSPSSSDKAYEINKQTSSSGAQASLPIYVLIIIVVILFIFGFGFFKRNKDDDDNDEF